MEKGTVKESVATIDEWIDKQTFNTTDEVEIPEKMADQVIGQDRAVEVIKKAAIQRRHVMLIGKPGTGKSMLAKSMVEYLSKDELQDVVAYNNPEESNEPRIRSMPAGKGKAIVTEQKMRATAQKNQKNFSIFCIIFGSVAAGAICALLTGNMVLLWLAFFVSIILMMSRTFLNKEIRMVPKLLVNHEPSDMPPFVDATGAHSGALFGDVRHDPFQSGGLETPAHERLEAGAIHKANKGVLYIDEIGTLKIESQQAILTVMQEKKMSITGQSERSSGSVVKSEPVPADFILVCAGNLDAIRGLHPALRSRIRGNGYEVYMESDMDDNDNNRTNIIRFIAQEIKKDGNILPFDKYAAGEIIKEAQRRSGTKGKLTLRLRELGGIIRASGDVAIQKGKKIVHLEDVIEAKKIACTVEQQITDRITERSKRYELFSTEGSKVGMINGLAVLNSNSDMAEYSGEMLPIVAEVTPSQNKKSGHVVATGKLGEIAEEAVKNVSAVIKKYTLTDITNSDIHIQFIGTYDGVEGDSASITIATAVISALENIPIDQTVAMTGSLSVRGKVLPIGGVTAKLEAAAQAGIKKAIIPKDNVQDVMIDAKYYDTMEIYSVETLRDVLEHAFVDCPRKQDYLDKLLSLNESGKSTAVKLKSFTVPPKKFEDSPDDVSTTTEAKSKSALEASILNKRFTPISL